MFGDIVYTCGGGPQVQDAELVGQEADGPATGELGGLATKLIAGMRDIRAFNRQAWSLERLRRLLLALRDARIYQGFVRG